MNNQKFQFKYYNGQQIKDKHYDLFNQMKNVFKSRDCNKEDVLNYLDDHHIVDYYIECDRRKRESDNNRKSNDK